MGNSIPKIKSEQPQSHPSLQMASAKETDDLPAKIEKSDTKMETIDECGEIFRQQASLIATQKEEIDRLSSIIDCNSATIISQAEEIQYSQQLIRTIRASKRREIEKIIAKYQEDKKKYMPCYHVGRLLREYKMSFRTFVPTADDSEKSWREARICNCAEHQGRPLADATMLLFDERLKPQEPLAYQVEEYLITYCVTPQVAFDNYTFKKFQLLLRIYADIDLFGVEGSTSPEAAEKGMDDVMRFIKKIWPERIYKADIDIENDPEARTELTRLIRLHESAIKRHHAVQTERYRRQIGLELPFDLLEIGDD